MLNAAMTVDGKIDTYERLGARISSPADLDRVDRLRADVDAVVVGGRTLDREDPTLVVRSPLLRSERESAGRDPNPAKVAITTRAAFDLAGRFATAGPARKIVYTTTQTGFDRITMLREAGFEVLISGTHRVDLVFALSSLVDLGVKRVLLEGGATLIAAFFALQLIDELSVYVAPKIFGGTTAPSLVDGSGFSTTQAPALHLVSVEPFDAKGGVLLRYLPSKDGGNSAP